MPSVLLKLPTYTASLKFQARVYFFFKEGFLFLSRNCKLQNHRHRSRVGGSLVVPVAHRCAILSPCVGSMRLSLSNKKIMGNNGTQGMNNQTQTMTLDTPTSGQISTSSRRRTSNWERWVSRCYRHPYPGYRSPPWNPPP